MCIYIFQPKHIDMTPWRIFWAIACAHFPTPSGWHIHLYLELKTKFTVERIISFILAFIWIRYSRKVSYPNKGACIPSIGWKIYCRILHTFFYSHFKSKEILFVTFPSMCRMKRKLIWILLMCNWSWQDNWVS